MTLLHGDCLETLKSLEARSIDSLVTDPPAGISFMGKEWDKDKGGRAGWVAWMTSIMTECHRVMKPGAHGLVWALPRTSHWTATALEDAGFEVRDIVTHLFGSGFPKSLNVGLAIDKTNGEPNRGRKVLRTEGQMNEMPDRDYSVKGVTYQPATDDAKKWQGWGTALKPASEHWILIRKPCSEKTVAANVLKWGCGAINVDASRVGNGGDYTVHNAGSSASGSLNWNVGEQKGSSKEYKTTQGRFPANIILSHTEDCEPGQCVLDCAVYALDRQSGTLKSGVNKTEYRRGIGFGGGSTGQMMDRPASEGGASRFFYCAKASKRDKGADNVHPTVKSTALMTYLIRMVTPPGGLVLDPFMGSGSTGVAAVQSGFQFIGIEREAEYIEIAKKRVEAS